jgi:hypothetical protein
MPGRLKKLFRKEIVILVPVLICAVLFRTSGARPTHFDNVHEFREFAVKNHLLLHPSGARGTVGAEDNFYVSDRPVSLEQLLSLTKHNCGLGSEWRGIIWVHGDSRRSYMWAESIGGHRRLWGNLLVAGDKKLLERVEELRRADT